ncbi:MAG: glycosyltransferase family protein [Dongiaceae bacterium]
MTRPLVFFYVQHLLGIGHLRRAAAIARAIENAGMAVAVVSGGEPVADIDFGAAQLIQLPPARSGDSGFAQIVDRHGAPVTETWWRQRRAALLGAFDRLAPDAVLMELFPFGRRPFRAELIPLLEAAHARRSRPVIVSSVRDVLVGKNDPRRLSETADIVRRFFDQVLIHGDPRVIEFGATFGAADRIAGQLRYTGYVVTPASDDFTSTAGRGEVLVSAGGGAVGAPLLRAALAARPLTALATAPWRLLTGLNASADLLAELIGSATNGVTVERFRRDFQVCLRNCRLSISQAGYNTVMEILAAGTRAVVVPFAEGGESEQPLRARLLAGRGLLGLVESDALDPRSLAAAIDRAVEGLAPSPSGIDMAGAVKTAAAMAELLKSGAGQGDRS